MPLIEVLKWISFWAVFLIGLGGSICALLWIWDKAFTWIVAMFNLKKEFIDFMWTKHRKQKTVKPSIKPKDE